MAQKEATRGKPLYLHVEALHPHRDSIVRLDDPIKVEEGHVVDKDKSLHRFTNHIAPIVLALYMIGHFLNMYHTLATNGDGTIDIDPMFGGYVLIGAGLMTIKWSIDNAFLSPV